jgi:transposase-like protein
LAATGAALFPSDRWFDPVKEAIRGRVRGVLEEILETELTRALQHRRYQRTATATTEAARPPPPADHRHGHRRPGLTGSFGTPEIDVPRARLETPTGGSQEWKSKSIESYRRRTRKEVR